MNGVALFVIGTTNEFYASVQRLASDAAEGVSRPGFQAREASADKAPGALRRDHWRRLNKGPWLARMHAAALRSGMTGRDPAATTACGPSHRAPDATTGKKEFAMSRIFATIGLAALLTGCGSVGVGMGISVPLIPGVSIGVGVGSGGVNAGVSAGRGPVSAGVGVNQRGQVTGTAGVGTSTSVGNASVGVGVGTGTVLYDPNDPKNRDKPADR